MGVRDGSEWWPGCDWVEGEARAGWVGGQLEGRCMHLLCESLPLLALPSPPPSYTLSHSFKHTLSLSLAHAHTHTPLLLPLFLPPIHPSTPSSSTLAMSTTIRDRKSLALASRLLAPKVRTYIKVQSRIANASRLAWCEVGVSAAAVSHALIKIANQAAMARTGKPSAYRIEEEDIKFACEELGLHTRPSLRGGMSTKRHIENEAAAAAAVAADDQEAEQPPKKKKKKAKTQ